MPDERTKVITLGRASDNTIVLDGTNVSNHHARFVLSGDEIVLEDLGSTNGTSVSRVENKIVRTLVMNEDTVFFGSTAYEVSDLLKGVLPDGDGDAVNAASSTEPGTGFLSPPVMLAGGGIAVAALIAIGLAINSMGSSNQPLANSDKSANEISEKTDNQKASNIDENGAGQIPLPTTQAASEVSTKLSQELVQRTDQGTAAAIPSDEPYENAKLSDTPMGGETATEPEQTAESSKAVSGPGSEWKPQEPMPEEAESSVPTETKPTPATEPNSHGPRMWTIARITGGRDVYSAKLLEHDNGTVTLQRRDDSIEKATVDRLHERDIEYLRGIVWSGKEEMSLQDALELGIIEARVREYAQDKLSVRLSSKGPLVVPNIIIPHGTWVEFKNHRKLGRIYLFAGEKEAKIRVDDWDRKSQTFWGGVGMQGGIGGSSFYAVPIDRQANVPVIDPPIGSGPYGTVHATISKTGVDPLAAEILSATFDGLDMKKLNEKTSMVHGKNSFLCKVAALWMSKNHDLDLSRFQTSVDSVLSKRWSKDEKDGLANTRPVMKDRFLAKMNWDPIEDHLRFGKHLLERARYKTREAKEGENNQQSGSRIFNIAEAIRSGVATVAGRKGLNGRVIILLTRTDSAPAGPMHISVPIGTVLFVNDGKEEPMRLYPFYDQRIDLFGQVADGCRCP